MFEERPTRAHIRKFYRAFYRRPIFWVGILVLLLVVARLLLDPLATRYTRQALEDMDGFQGRFSDVQIGVFPPHYGISHLKIIEVPGRRHVALDSERWNQPLLYVDQLDGHLDWRMLFRGNLGARARIERAKVTIVQRKAAKEEKEDAEKQVKKLPDLAAQLEQAPPLLVQRIEIKDSEVLYRDATAEGRPELWLHRIEAAIENFGTREKLVEGRPGTVTARALLQSSGQLTSFVSMDPFAKGITFSGRTQLRDLKLADLHQIIVANTDLKADEGTVDMFAEYQCKDGVLTGGVKPVLKNVEIRATDDSLGNRLKAWLADTTLDIFSDRVPGRKAVATTIPIKGRLNDPDIQLLPTVLGVVRNAFVEGLASGFSNLPPKTSDKEEGALKQVKDAITGKEPPEAQPGDADKKDDDKKGDDKKDDDKKGDDKSKTDDKPNDGVSGDGKGGKTDKDGKR